MRRLDIFLIIFTITISLLVTLAAVSWYFAATTPSYYGSSWMGQMWGEGGNVGNYGGEGGMMGGSGYYGNGYGAAPSYLWIIPVALIAIAVTAVLGVGFYLAYPELKYIRGSSCKPQKTGTAPNQVNNMVPATNSVAADVPSDSTVSNRCDVLLKTMTPEEQKVFNVLINHQGKYLQKYVTKEAELSRLKTHRIIARFAQRGIVSVKEFGNTNEVLLSDWVATTR